MRNLPLKPKEKEKDGKPIMQEKGTQSLLIVLVVIIVTEKETMQKTEIKITRVCFTIIQTHAICIWLSSINRLIVSPSPNK